MIHHAIQQYEYHVWANDRLLTHLQQLPEDVYHKDVTSVFPSVAHTFGHMYLFERLYLDVLAAVPHEQIFPKMQGWTEEAQGKTVDETKRLFASSAALYRELLDRTPNLDSAMTIEHPRYGRLDTRFSDIVVHVVNHGTYHRGNVAAMLRQLGCAGVPTDYIFYLMEREKRGMQ